MGLNKTVLILGIACAVPAIVCVAANVIMKHHKAKVSKSIDVDDGMDLILECFDEMICDIRQIHKRQKDQGERLSRLEESLFNLLKRTAGK